jgi:hypothetical protein
VNTINNALQSLISKAADAVLKKLDLPATQPTEAASPETQGGPVDSGARSDKYKFSAKDSFEGNWSGSASGEKEFNLKPETQQKLEAGAQKLGNLQQYLESKGIKPGLNTEIKQEWSGRADAHSSGSIKGERGEAEYKLDASAEYAAAMSGQMALNLNGLQANANVKVGGEASVQVTGRASTNFNVAGVNVPVSADARLKATAKGAAEAQGSVQVTRDPLKAVAQGSAGASAVLKAEGDLKLSAGPFSLKASAYASVGAEVQASGKFGYEDGKIKIGGSVGAALGFGAGASVDIEIDVKQLGEMAKDAAVNMAKEAASYVADKAAEGVNKAASFVKGLFGF